MRAADQLALLNLAGFSRGLVPERLVHEHRHPVQVPERGHGARLDVGEDRLELGAVSSGEFAPCGLLGPLVVPGAGLVIGVLGAEFAVVFCAMGIAHSEAEFFRKEFEEKTKGTLEVGKYADMVVLTKDILTVPEEEIPSARVAYTIGGGKVRYKQ